MTLFLRSRSLQAVVACMLFLCLTSVLHAQGITNTNGPLGQNWPGNPPVGIGTVGSGIPRNALHIHHNPGNALTWPAILRLSDGATDSINTFGALALMPDTSPAFYDTWSNLATQYDLVLHEHDGDMILANFNVWGGAIRLSTTPDPTTVPPGTVANDLERMTILQNGNVGINLPPGVGGFCAPSDQVQIGGGSIAPAGYAAPIPGLTIYGGNRFEGMAKPLPDTGTYPVDWRGIAFNHWEDHRTGIGSRIAPMSWSGIGFDDADGGLIDLSCYPWHTGDSLIDNSGNMTLQLQGNTGLYLWCDDRAIGGSQYHHLFEVWRKGYNGGLGIRNDSGLFFHHTPVYIGGTDDVNFTNLANERPDMGDDSTWMLAVNGPALVKELFILDTVWADYVFQPGYTLMPTQDLERYIEMNHHLPGVPSASQIAKTGVPIGRTEAAITKNVEELTLRTIQLSKQNKALAEQNTMLRHAVEQLQRDVSELKEKVR